MTRRSNSRDVSEEIVSLLRAEFGVEADELVKDLVAACYAWDPTKTSWTIQEILMACEYYARGEDN